MSKTMRKTESLSYPRNPLAAMRELQELNSPGAGQGVKTNVDLTSATAIPVALPESSVVAGATISQPSSAHGSKRSGKVVSTTESDAPTNPMREAILEMLSRPYALDSVKGPFTVTTVKVPTEVWERLGWVASLTGQPKQEIIAEALKEHFDRVKKGK